MATKACSALLLVLSLILRVSSALAAPPVWHLENPGTPVPLRLDAFRTRILSARVGEDVGVRRKPTPPAPLREVRVAVLDTGVDAAHPDLQGKLVDPPPAGIPREGYRDPIGHGTHVAGLIAANLGPLGTQGIAPNARILPLAVIRQAPNAPIRPQALGAPGSALAPSVERGLRAAIDAGVELIHLSLAWPEQVHTSRLEALLAEADAREILVIASAGNDATSARVRPCGSPTVICVGAHDPDGSAAFYSNRGSTVDLWAPGSAILSLWPTALRTSTYTELPGYEVRSGTSMAAPLVTGALAYLKGLGHTAREARQLLLGSVRSSVESPLPRLDLAQALQATTPPARLVLLNKPRVRALSQPGLRGEVSLEFQLLGRDLNPQEQWELRIPNSVEAWEDLSLTLDDRGTPWKSGETRTATLRWRFAARQPFASEPAGRFSLPLEARLSDSTAQPVRLELPVELYHLVGESAGSKNLRRIEFPAAEQQRTADTEVRVLDRAHTLLVDPDAEGHARLRVFRSTSAPGQPEQMVQVFRARTATKVQRYLSAHWLPATPKDPATLVSVLQLPIETVGGLPPFRFEWHRASDGGFLGGVTLDPRETALSETLHFSLENGRFSPVWVALGKIPAADLPAADPWNPEPANPLIVRSFRADRLTGLRLERALNDSVYPLGFAPRADVNSPLTLLTLDYSSGILRWDAETITTPAPIPIDSLRGLTVWGKNRGLALSVVGSRGSLEVLLIPTPGQANRSARVLTLLPSVRFRESRGDSVLGILSAAPTGIFFETRFELGFQRLSEDGDAAGAPEYTDLERFSFLPQALFQRITVPVETSAGPGLFTPEGLGATREGEILVAPDSAAPGALRRPLAARFRSPENCDSTAAPFEQTLLLLCPDHWKIIPLESL